ncbi:MAG: RNA-directed DNA polymerase [Kiritimatiellae bacterium]|nr:RNA-directed DNA polymerase [Kiritimatiellia bacterium]
MSMAPELLAMRAVNQYRKRDIVGYLGVRLYLRSICAVRDRWAREVSTFLATHVAKPMYHESLHFKERDHRTNEIVHRRVCIPTPNDILAESALFDACSKCGNSFLTAPMVYSYQLASGKERWGVFIPYFYGFKKRHRDIADAARQAKNDSVVYTDIRKFYPSITYERALAAWMSASKGSGLPNKYVLLGRNMLKGNRDFCSDAEQGVLTGPMFSHLIANLVFRSIDEKMTEAIPNGYFRYVDDIALVGSRADVMQAEQKLNDLLDQSGFEVHPKKRFEISADEWLKGENDFNDESDSISWKTFIGKMKRLLVYKPELTEEITSLLSKNGFRIRPLNYSSAINDQHYLARLRFLITKVWVRKSIYRATPAILVHEAKQLNERYMHAFWDWVNKKADNKYEQKRRIHGLRRYASKLIYLAAPEDLSRIAEVLLCIPEMEIYGVIFDAIDSGNVSKLVLYGADVAYAAVCPLLITHQSVICDINLPTDAVRQAIAILNLYGLKIRIRGAELSKNEMNQFCEWKSDWSVSEDEEYSYFDELASLHGFSSQSLHQEILSSAFDVNDDMISDIAELLDNYAS